MNNQVKQKTYIQGFSIVEIAIVVAAIGVLAAMVIPTINGLRSSTSETKLQSDILTANQAIRAYRASGGRIVGVTDPVVIVSKLRSRAKIDPTYDAIGFTGSLLDPRIFLLPVTGEHAGAKWNPSKLRFERVSEGDRFTFATAETPFEVVAEDRDNSLFAFDKEGWVWHYDADASSNPHVETTLVTLTQPIVKPTVYAGPRITVSPIVTVMQTLSPNSAINPGFETDNGRNNRVTTWSANGKIAYTTNEANVRGWKTTATDSMIEVWESGFNNVTSYAGNYHIEFNANEVSTIWQEVDTSNAEVVKIFFAHGQRNNTSEQLKLLVGLNPPAKKTNKNQVENLVAQGFHEVMTTNTSKVGGWKTYSTSYPIPPGVNKMYFAFQSIGQFATLSVGNFLDEVSFQKVIPLKITGFDINISAGSSSSNVIESAEVTLVAPRSGDKIDFPTLPTGYILETDTSGGNIKLTITGRGTRTFYSNLLKTLVFSTTSSNTENRSLLFSIHDGFQTSGNVPYTLVL